MKKKEAKFILDKPKSELETLIILKFATKDSTPLRYSTQQKIKPGDWDFSLQRAKKNKNINSELDRLSRIVDAYIESQRLLGNRNIYKIALKKELDSKNDREEVIKTNNFYSCLEKLVKDAENGVLLTQKLKNKYTEGTTTNWTKTINKLKEYNPSLEFETITLETYNGFYNFCNNKSYTANYTGTLIKNWKTLMGIAHSKKWHNNTIYMHPDFKKIQEESEQVYLSDDEIQRIIDLDLSDNKKQQIIRDRYVINLYNGLRVSDMITLSSANIQNNLITHINQKTNIKVVIPVHDVITKIIKKYKGNMPKQYHQNTVNKEIKKIARAAKINEIVMFSKTIGGEVQKFEKQKWQMITNHTARRSMATNLLKHVNIIEAMPVMGMSLKTLQYYNKLTAEENANNLKSNKFFKKK